MASDREGIGEEAGGGRHYLPCISGPSNSSAAQSLRQAAAAQYCEQRWSKKPSRLRQIV